MLNAGHGQDTWKEHGETQSQKPECHSMAVVTFIFTNKFSAYRQKL